STDRIAAGFLELGLDRGERVAILMPNRPTLVEALFGAFKAGLTAVPLNMRLHPREVEYIVRHSGAKAIVLDRELAGDVRPALAGLTSLRQLDPDDLPRAAHAVLPEPAASDPAWIFYTSGTTGRPKGAVLTHANLVAMSVGCIADIY